MVGGAHGGFPGGALVEFAVGAEVEHPRGGVLVAQSERHPDGDGESVAEGAAGDFHAGGVGGHARHREAGVVGAVGVQFAARDDPGLGEGGVEADRVVAGGEQEPVALVPVRVLGAVAQAVGVDGGEDVGGAEGLSDVALALFLAHVQGVVPDAVGELGDGRDAGRVTWSWPRWVRWWSLEFCFLARGVRGRVRGVSEWRLERALVGWALLGWARAIASSVRRRSAGPQVSWVTSAAIRPIRA